MAVGGSFVGSATGVSYFPFLAGCSVLEGSDFIWTAQRACVVPLKKRPIGGSEVVLVLLRKKKTCCLTEGF